MSNNIYSTVECNGSLSYDVHRVIIPLEKFLASVTKMPIVYAFGGIDKQLKAEHNLEF